MGLPKLPPDAKTLPEDANGSDMPEATKDADGKWVFWVPPDEPRTEHSRDTLNICWVSWPDNANSGWPDSLVAEIKAMGREYYDIITQKELDDAPASVIVEAIRTAYYSWRTHRNKTQEQRDAKKDYSAHNSRRNQVCP